MTYALELTDAEIELEAGDQWVEQHGTVVRVRFPRLTLAVEGEDPEQRIRHLEDELIKAHSIFRDGVDCSPQNVRDWIDECERLEAANKQLGQIIQQMNGTLAKRQGELEQARASAAGWKGHAKGLVDVVTTQDQRIAQLEAQVEAALAEHVKTISDFSAVIEELTDGTRAEVNEAINDALTAQRMIECGGGWPQRFIVGVDPAQTEDTHVFIESVCRELAAATAVPEWYVNCW